MSDQHSGPQCPVGVVDVARGVPQLLADAPGILRGLGAGLLVRPTSRTSIGKVFQDRAHHHADRVFLRFGDVRLTYREANETVNRYAAVLTDRDVGRGDVVGIMLRNSPHAVLMMLAAAKCGAISGMVNYHQRGGLLAHSLGLLNSKVLVTESDLVDTVAECCTKKAPGAAPLPIEDVERLALAAPNTDSVSVLNVRANDVAFYIFTSGTTGYPKASVMTHHRWLRAMATFGAIGVRLRRDDVLFCALPLYHNNALTVALSSVLTAGATLALAPSFSASQFWAQVIAADATAFIYIGEFCRYLLNQPAKPTDRAHRVRVICGNGLRPEIWDEFTVRFGVKRVCEFYAASESNTAFLNIFNVPRSTGLYPLPLAYVEYDPDTGEPARGRDGWVRRVPSGRPGLLLSPVTRFSPFDGYTNPEDTEKKLVRNAFRWGDCWFNTGDLMRPQGLGHAAFVDRLGDTFRWKGENVATTEVEAALGGCDFVEESAVYGVEVPRTGGRAGMAAVKLRDGASFDGQSLAKVAYDRLPPYAVPLFVRLVESMTHTSTFKSRKVELRQQSYGDDKPGGMKDPLYVLASRDEGYIPYYLEYPGEVADGKRPST